jgi:aspartokinase-like uncharacterized kinase
MNAHEPRPRIVVKVGGSLYDLPDLRTRLRLYLATLADADLLLVPGGGPTADVVRGLDRVHSLGEGKSHWLALRALTLNGHFLHALLPEFEVSADVLAPRPRMIVDMHAFALADEEREESLAHRWDVTSDSLAVRVAHVTAAREIILIKSVPWLGDIESAARAGHVDASFLDTLRRQPLPVRWHCMR